ncbi:MAG: hypothetical protein ACRDOE_03905, partial [Streptosporangiaceae bacterium]
AEYLSHLDDDEAAGAAIGEARDIAGRLRCQPRLDRAAGLLPGRTADPGLDGDRTYPAAIRTRTRWVSRWSGRIETSWLSRTPAR